ncbi:ScyD/ScyE family protein [Agrococcus lahaulensis]|uniref:ScyD/ScyE family protein n=1 Tax=Agrococcus lahaulensis TaxID=341722 RepID=UPI0012EB1DB1|nr:ScyD/ScyE family protein [Agrococcus lahaulensis]
MSRKLRSTVVAAVAAAALGLSLIAASGPPALAGDDRRGGGHGGGHHGGVVTVATGLDNPRQLSVGPGNRLYVAEAGVADACEPIAGADDFQVCGLTGAVTEVRRHGQRRVVTDLPAMALGTDVIGASDVAVRGNRIDVLIGGLSGGTAFRDALPDEYAILGTLRSERLRWGGLEGDDLDLVADLAAFEIANNPDGNEPFDSNAVGFAALGHGRWVVADAGGNSLVRVGRGGERLVAAFPNGAPVPNPFGPGEIPPQAVPTDVAVGPDGAYYVSQLTGFPFPNGGSTIWRVTRDGEVSAYATGLTLVTSLAWKGRTLYAVQHDDDNLLDGSYVGSLRRVTPGGSTHEAVIDGLSSPYGVAIQGRSAYVTVDSTSADIGSVIRVSLR